MENAEFERRRRDLMRMVGEEGIAILPAAPEQRRNRDVFHPFRQDSDFWYLTGFDEPDAVAVLAPGRAHGEYLLFCRERDPEREVWDGPIVGQERAVSEHGADDAFPIDDIDDILPGLIEGRAKVYCTMGADPEFDHRLIGWVGQVRARARSGVRAPAEYVALEHPLHELRLVKSRAELDVMRRAADVSAAAHGHAMSMCRPGLYEYEIEAEFQAAFRRHDGCAAYPPIVGGGANACVLHYVRNGECLRDGDLLLIDAGVELENYASDITRTFPVNGRFSAEQRAVYEIVLAAQQAAIDAVRPGNHWNAPHEAATRVLVTGMVDLGLLRGEVDGLIERGDYRPFFMHRTGHWLGMDVHDVGDYRIDGHWREFEPGMVLTVEPGLYLSERVEGVPAHLANIGIRIEDDVVVTREGNEVISTAAPKDVAEIEAVMAG